MILIRLATLLLSMTGSFFAKTRPGRGGGDLYTSFALNTTRSEREMSLATVEQRKATELLGRRNPVAEDARPRVLFESLLVSVLNDLGHSLPSLTPCLPSICIHLNLPSFRIDFFRFSQFSRRATATDKGSEFVDFDLGWKSSIASMAAHSATRALMGGIREMWRRTNARERMRRGSVWLVMGLCDDMCLYRCGSTG